MRLRRYRQRRGPNYRWQAEALMAWEQAGTGDEGVTINDHEEFQNVACIHDVDATECPAFMRDLLSGKRPRCLPRCTRVGG